MIYRKDHIPKGTACNRRPGNAMSPTTEEWVDIQGYEGHYQISSLGRVKSLPREIMMKNGVPRPVREKFIFPKIKENGYRFVQLYLNGKMKNCYVHRLVAEHFISNPSKLSDVNHKDGDKNNNSISNLEWVTHSENLIHAYRNNLKVVGEEHIQSKLTKQQVTFIRKYYKPFDPLTGAKPLAERFGVSKSTISTIASGKKRVHG